MEDIFKPIECNDDDVVDFVDNTYKVGKIKTGLSKASNSSLSYRLQEELSNLGIEIPFINTFFKEGQDCQILTLGSQNWKKGKVKFNLSIEFYIEDDLETTNSNKLNITEPESPLDDLRRMIHEENS